LSPEALSALPDPFRRYPAIRHENDDSEIQPLKDYDNSKK
jgi:hypothetical protein